MLTYWMADVGLGDVGHTDSWLLQGGLPTSASEPHLGRALAQNLLGTVQTPLNLYAGVARIVLPFGAISDFRADSVVLYRPFEQCARVARRASEDSRSLHSVSITL